MQWKHVFSESVSVPLEWSVKGYEMVDSQERFIGPIRELLYDENAGVVRYAVVLMGGGVGIDGKQLIIPAELVKKAGSGTLIVDSTVPHLTDAPMIEDIYCPTREEEELFFRHFGIEPYWEKPEEDVKRRAIPEDEETIDISSLDIGTPTMDKDDA